MNIHKQLVLIDGSSFLYRAYHASKNGFTNSKGQPTGVCLIITKMLQNILKKFSNSDFIMIFDAKGKSFRNEIYSQYKANRPPMPDDLRSQIEYVHKIVKGLGFPLVSIEGVEADDVIGTYASKATENNIKTIICTGDKDLAQLVDKNITLYDSMNDVYYDETGVVEKFGVKPSLIIDFLALKGDSSDNIPGMAGCGDKTAVSLLNEIGPISEIEKNLDKIPTLSFRGAKTFKDKFVNALDSIHLSYTLATIKKDVDVPFELDDVPELATDYDALIDIFTELEFKKILIELKSQRDNGSSADKVEEKEESSDTKSEETMVSLSDSNSNLIDYREYGASFVLVDTLEKLLALVSKINSAQFVAFDTETTSLNTRDCKIVGMSLCMHEGEAFYIPINHCYINVGAQLDPEIIKELLIPALNRKDLKIIGHNIKFDLEVMHYQSMDLNLGNIYADTMILAHLLDSSAAVNMDDLAKAVLSYKTISYEEVVGDKKKVLISQCPIEKVLDYAAEDAIVTFRLYKELSQKLFLSKKDTELFFDMEMPLLKVLYKMELNGVYVDKNELEKQNVVLKEELVKIQSQIYASCDCEFNISSPKQLSEVLFTKMQIPYPKKVKAGAKLSTSEEILEAIAPNYDVANLILRYRELSKLISTYTEKLQTIIDGTTNRIYSSFNQAGTVTGRLSSSDPNLQNIPARTPEGKSIRKAFVAPSGYTLVAADYSQIELRIIAHMSEDPTLIKAFNEGYDIHKATAAEVLQIPLDSVTSEQRSHAKATNFGLMYGMSSFGLAKQTHMSQSEAKVYMERYFARYPKLNSFMEEIKQFAKTNEFVKAVDGRKIGTPNVNSSNALMSKAALRAAINAPMQGSAADIIKIAMIRLNEWIDSLPENTVRMTVQVHDELLFEVKNEFLDTAISQIEKIMSEAYKLKVPLIVGVGASSNWADAH